MIHVILMSDIKIMRIDSIDVFFIFDVSMDVKVTILMTLLSYKSFKDGTFRSKHVCDYLLRDGALRIREEESFRLKTEWHYARLHYFAM